MSTSSNLSTFSNNPFVVSIFDFVHEKLDMSNYLAWSYFFTTVLKIYDLEDHLKANVSPLEIIISSNNKIILNPDYSSWRKLDQLILSWINETITKKVFPLLYHSKSAHDAWVALEEHFMDKSTSREHQSFVNYGQCS